MTDKPPRMTTDSGIPVASDEFSLTVGPDGPILLQDQYLIGQMANFNRERIAERQPHAKGSGPLASSRRPRMSAPTPSDKVLARAFEYWKNVDQELGERVEQAVGATVGA
jgi:catalase